MKQVLQRFFAPVLLILITGIISVLNYTPGTWLTGWDTLHPEFDFWLNFKRIFFGVWRADQGLGAVAAHSHMVELPRMVILGFLSIFLHESFLRYAYIFLCFILGPLGVYIFLRRTILGDKTVVGSIAAFLGALFYIFNLGTVQHFFVPFEMFMAQYAALGWIFYFATEYMIRQKKKLLLFFALVSFFASSMAYASVLWYAFLAGFVFYLLTICLIVKQKHLFRAATMLVLTVICVNAYWLFPNWYFLKNHAVEVPNAATNLLFSQEAFLHNKEYGVLKDAIIFKNFLFNWNEQTGPGLIYQHKILEAWDAHLANPFILAIGYVAFIFVVGGVLVAFFDRTASRQTLKIAIFPLGLLALIMIINMNPPFSYVFDLLRDQITLFREGLRFPWTKFSLLLLFAMSCYFGLFWYWLFKQKLFKKLPFQIATGIVVSVLLIIYCWPMFQGQFINKQLRITIPQEYFALFKWFDEQPANGRVAPLPMHAPWGWEYYRWGYQGSGFLWFGIKQPVLARDFDRWNTANEQYYRNMGTALYARDVKQVEVLADTYQIRYFILDENIIFPENKPNALWIAETKDVFAKSGRFHLAKQFGNVSVYEFDLSRETHSYLQSPYLFTTVGPEMTGGYQDHALLSYPHYVGSKTPHVTYPFRNMIDRYGKFDPQQITFTDTTGILTLGTIPEGYVPTNWSDESIYPSIIDSQDLVVEKESTLIENARKFSVTFPVTTKPIFFKDLSGTPRDCGSQSGSDAERQVIDDYVSLSATATTSCDYVSIATSQDLGYLLVVETRHSEGLPMRFCVSSHITRRCDTYTQLTSSRDWTKEIFVIPPYPTGPADSAGFDIHFNTVSIGRVRSQNDIRSVQLIVFPYYRLTNLAFVHKEGSGIANQVYVSDDSSTTPVSYMGQLNGKTEDHSQGLFVLNQAYEDGWFAYLMTRSFPFIEPIGEHGVFNNWSNSWVISDVSRLLFPVQIYIVFLPQLLQYLGFALLPLPFVYALWPRKKKV